MDKPVFLNGTSVDSVIEASDSVPYVVQTDSSGGLGFIGFILIVMMIVLILLVIALILIELRQDTLRNMVFGIAERLEALEKKIKKPTDERTFSASKEAEKRTVKRVAFNRAASSDNQTASFTGKPNTSHNADFGKTRKNDPPDVISNKVGRNTYYTNDPVLTGAIAYAYNAAGNSGKPHLTTGLRVNDSSYYNQSSRVRLDDIPVKDAVFILYSDMTVRPNEEQFNAYNNAAYYTGHDFTMIFDFQDKEGYQLDMRRPFKCLEVERPAKVTRSKNGYILEEKGILIAEER